MTVSLLLCFSYFFYIALCYVGVYQAESLSFGNIDGKSNIQIIDLNNVSQSAITCSKLKIETLEKGVKYIQS